MYTNSGSSWPWATRWAADSRYMAKSPTGRVGTSSTQVSRKPVARATIRIPCTAPVLPRFPPRAKPGGLSAPGRALDCPGRKLTLEKPDGTTTAQQDALLRPSAHRRAHPGLRSAPLGGLGAPRRVPLFYLRVIQPGGGRPGLRHPPRPLARRRPGERRPDLLAAVPPERRDP